MTAFARMTRRLQAFGQDTSGAVLAETLIVLPFLTLLAAGILEFGMVFWERQQVETGLRDAARYMARCRHPEATCNANARNLAYYGTVAGSGALRVPNWKADTAPINFVTTTVAGTEVVVSATTTLPLLHSGMFAMLDIDDITLSASHDQRSIGW